MLLAAMIITRTLARIPWRETCWAQD